MSGRVKHSRALPMLITAGLLVTGCASSTYWGSGDKLAWVRSGTGVNEVVADAEICALELEDHELLPVIAPSWEVVLGGWYVNRYREFRSRGRYRRCMERQGYRIVPVAELDGSAVLAIKLKQQPSSP